MGHRGRRAGGTAASSRPCPHRCARGCTPEPRSRPRVRTAHLLGRHHHFGPASGSDPKIKEALARYVLTVFAHGTLLGPAQVAAHMRGKVSVHELTLAGTSTPPPARSRKRRRRSSARSASWTWPSSRRAGFARPGCVRLVQVDAARRSYDLTRRARSGCLRCAMGRRADAGIPEPPRSRGGAPAAGGRTVAMPAVRQNHGRPGIDTHPRRGASSVLPRADACVPAGTTWMGSEARGRLCYAN